MGPLIGVVVVALIAYIALAAWRGRLVAVALAGAECPDCRVPFVALRRPTLHPASGPRLAEGSSEGDVSEALWEVGACPGCDRVVTTVNGLPSPLADCPACRQRSLVVYAERVDGSVVVDEWCDLCGRRSRTTLDDAPAPRRPEHPPAGLDPQGPSARVDPDPTPRPGRVLPFRRER